MGLLLLICLSRNQKKQKQLIIGENAYRTSEAAFAVNRNGQIVSWNKAAESTFGYSKTQAIGRRCWELLRGRDLFGNIFCCDGCAIRTAAFCNETVHRFQVDLLTAARKRIRLTIVSLMLLAGPDTELLVHLCFPESGAARISATSHISDPPSRNEQNNILTARETEVLRLLHNGNTVAEIATVLNISVYTVRNHTQHVLLKLKVHSQLEAVALSRNLGLI